MRPVVLALMLVLTPLAGCLDGDDSPPLPAPEDPATVGPEWSFLDTDGMTHTRDSPDSNATVVFFMASWCSTCRTKAPLLANVHEDYAAQDVRFYSVSWDSTDDDGSLQAWKERHAQPWPHGIDPQFGIQRTFGITAQSSVVVLDANGNLVQRWGYNGVNEAALRAALDEALSRSA